MGFLRLLVSLFKRLSRPTRPTRSTVTPPPLKASVVVTFNNLRLTSPVVKLRLDQFEGQEFTATVEQDYYLFTLPPETVEGWGADLIVEETVETDRYQERRIFHTAIEPAELRQAGVNPADIPLEQLARIRGAMWTETLPLSLGPRPGSPDNVAATDFLWNYSPEEREALVANLRGLGYTHCVVGPIVDSDGYHGAWTPNDWRQKWDSFLDMLQFLWDHGLAPVVFIHPDHWTLEETKALGVLFQSERAQKLIRIIVPAGWEPTRYEWSNATWVEFAKWGREMFPNALCLLHTVSDVDAPVGTDERGDDNGKLSNADGWRRIAPYLHGWLTQTSTYERKDGYEGGLSNFQNWVNLFNPAIPGSYKHRFTAGYAGWPTFSAWGNAPLKVYAGEYLAYWVFWQRVPKEVAREWGDAALRAGADGYLDGGTLPVGEGAVPWAA